MGDFRQELYSAYVSTFKHHSLDDNASEKQAEFERNSHYFLPHLSAYDKQSSILELGCGPGFFLEFLQSNGYLNAQGIDISEEQIACAGKRGVKARVKDIFAYFAESQEVFDVIIALDVIEHLTKEELLIFANGVYKLLKPGGLLMLRTPNGQGLFAGRLIYGDLTHVSILTPDSAHQLLSRYCFRNIQAFEVAPAPRNLKGVIRLLLWKMVKIAVNMIKVIECGDWYKVLTQNMIITAKREK